MTKQNRNVAINQFLVNLYEFRRELRILLATIWWKKAEKAFKIFVFLN